MGVNEAPAQPGPSTDLGDRQRQHVRDKVNESRGYRPDGTRADKPKADKPKADKPSKPDKPKLAMAQTKLKTNGFDPGPIDGIVGPKTVEAVKAFQASKGMTEDGKLNAKTFAALGV